MSRSRRIAIIGAGIGGLSAAAHLAHRAQVDVFEAQPRVGGKVRQAHFGPHSVDIGPTVFTLKFVLDEVFARAGTNFDAELTARPLDTLARHVWRDGAMLDLKATPEDSAREIAAFAGPAEARRFLAFMAKARQTYETLLDPFMRAPSPSMTDLIARAGPIALLGIDAFSTLWEALSRQFSNPRLRQLFARYATYSGASPFEAPATLMLIAHVEQAGVWLLDGGMAALPAALARVAEGSGARLHLSTPIAGIAAEGGRATGVRLTPDGPVERYDAVIFNGDVAALAQGHLGPDARSAVSLPPEAIRSQSALTFAWLTEPKGRELSCHTVFFSDDYRAEFDAVFDARTLPATPTAYLFAPQRAGGAQSGGPEPVFALINAPADGDFAPLSATEIASCRTRLLDHLSRCGLSLSTLEEQITAPQDFAALFPATGGALYGMASHGWRASFQRPGVRSRIRGLYLAGGSAHPGAGVPMAALSGMAAADQILKDFGLTRP
jgi:1-hydroxycarotenoid 3,4-desaturase